MCIQLVAREWPPSASKGTAAVQDITTHLRRGKEQEVGGREGWEQAMHGSRPLTCIHIEKYMGMYWSIYKQSRSAMDYIEREQGIG